MWCQVEVGLDGGVLERTSPFRRTSLVPQIAAYHNKLPKEVLHSLKYILTLYTLCSLKMRLVG